MAEFSNVTVIKAANVYFDGKVTSRTVVFPDGSKKTLGVMLPGAYEFIFAAIDANIKAPSMFAPRTTVLRRNGPGHI